jgi:hypothetical protein
MTLVAVEQVAGFVALSWSYDGVAYATGCIRVEQWRGALGAALREGVDFLDDYTDIPLGMVA